MIILHIKILKNCSINFLIKKNSNKKMYKMSNKIWWGIRLKNMTLCVKRSLSLLKQDVLHFLDGVLISQWELTRNRTSIDQLIGTRLTFRLHDMQRYFLRSFRARYVRYVPATASAASTAAAITIVGVVFAGIPMNK